MLGTNVSAFYNSLKRKSSSNSSSVFAEEKHLHHENGIKHTSKFFNNGHIENNIEDIFDEKGILREANANHYEQGNESEVTPKMEKKASVSQLFSNIKSKFGSTSSRKRVKKSSKNYTNDTSYSSRLLWKTNGEWLDRWFNYSDGILAGYKDASTAKPAEILLDVRTCKLTTLNHRQNIVKSINLFQLTTHEENAHLFIAWNEDQFKSWLECLTLAVELKDELYGLRFEKPSGYIEDANETDIIPYSHSLETEQRKVTSSSSDTSGVSGHGRVDSIDSGNDGDESGLESSLSSTKRITDIRRIKSEKDKKTRGPRIIENELVKAKSTSKIDLSRKLSHESTSTENDLLSPNIEFNVPLGETLTVGNEISKKKQRSSFIQKKWNFFDSKPKKEEKQATEQKIQKLSSPKELTVDKDSMIINSVESPPYKRPDSLDISSVTMPLSSWEGFGTQGRFKKMSIGSEDDMSDTYSVPSIVDDKIHEDIEDVLREETLLRKRRNSLTLERTQIANKLEVLRETDNLITNTVNNNHKKHSKHHLNEKTEDLIIDSEQKKVKMQLLEQKIDSIDIAIEDIDKRIFNNRIAVTDDKNWTSTQHRQNNIKSLTKLRLHPKSRPIHDLNSQSIESLSSSASRESSLSRDTCDSIRLNNHKNHFQFNNNNHINKSKLINIPKTPDSEDGGRLSVSPNPSTSSGIEELMMTTQRLESSSSNTDEMKGMSQSSPVGIWRSKSLGSVELLKSKPTKMDINQNNTSAETIIEDFEKFSEMLTSRMHDKDHQINV